MSSDGIDASPPSLHVALDEIHQYPTHVALQTEVGSLSIERALWPLSRQAEEQAVEVTVKPWKAISPHHPNLRQHVQAAWRRMPPVRETHTASSQLPASQNYSVTQSRAYVRFCSPSGIVRRRGIPSTWTIFAGLGPADTSHALHGPVNGRACDLASTTRVQQHSAHWVVVTPCQKYTTTESDGAESARVGVLSMKVRRSTRATRKFYCSPRCSVGLYFMHAPCAPCS